MKVYVVLEVCGGYDGGAEICSIHTTKKAADKAAKRTYADEMETRVEEWEVQDEYQPESTYSI